MNTLYHLGLLHGNEEQLLQKQPKEIQDTIIAAATTALDFMTASQIYYLQGQISKATFLQNLSKTDDIKSLYGNIALMFGDYTRAQVSRINYKRLTIRTSFWSQPIHVKRFICIKICSSGTKP